MAPAVMAANLPCDFYFNISDDPDSSTRIKIEASVPEDMYLGFAFGMGIMADDQVRFVGSGDGSVEDLWGSAYELPTMDDQQDYVDTTVELVYGDDTSEEIVDGEENSVEQVDGEETSVELVNGIYNFVTYRNKVTNDGQDF